MLTGNSHYRFGSDGPSEGQHDLWPRLKACIAATSWSDKRVFEIGCGNGSTARALSDLGWKVTAVDTSPTGITFAKSIPNVRAEIGDAYENLAAKYGTFPLVVSLNVICHCDQPLAFAKTFLSLIESGGVGFLSTPYYGYWKKVLLAVSGKLDAHLTNTWPAAPVRFYSQPALANVLRLAGAKELTFELSGRWPRALAKNLIAIVRNHD